MDEPRARVHGLLTAASEAHDEFAAAVARIDPGLREAPGLVGMWNATELLAHVAHWAENAVAALEAASAGRADTYGDADLDVDAINAEVAAAAADRSYAEMERREASAYAGLVEALQRAEERVPPLGLDERVRYGDSIESVVRDDTIDHYLEHAADIRAWFDEDEPE